MQPTDLTLIRHAGMPSLAPDGSRVVVAVSHPDFATDANVSLLREFAVADAPEPAAAGAGRLLTRGPSDTSPAFSPDGALLAFLRTAPAALGETDMGQAPQLHVVDARGGEAVAMTDLPLGVTAFRWLPDCEGIICEAPVPVEGRYRPDIEPGAEPPRTLPGFQGRADGHGYVFDRPHHLFYVPVTQVHSDPSYEPVGRAKANGDAERFDVKLPPVTRLTRGEVGFSLTAVTASHALAIAGLHEGHDADVRTDLFAIRIKTKGEDPDQPIALTTSGGPEIFAVSGACPVGEGLYLAASSLGETGLDFVGRSDALYRIDDLAAALAGDPLDLGHAQRLTDPDSQRLIGPFLAAGPTDLICGLERRGSTLAIRIAPDGELTELTAEGSVVTGWDANDAGKIVVTYGDHTSPSEVGVIAAGIERLSDLARPLRAAQLITPQERTYDSADGYPVHGWVLLPDKTIGAPVILMIHGGPHAAYGPAVFDEAQVLAAAGYAVVMCNPRGSSGYGTEHARAIRHALGTLDADDVLAFLDGALAEFSDLGDARLGIMGGSYGGYLTAWIIAHHHRFAGAIVERGYLDPATFAGPSDIGWFFSEQYVGTDPAQVAAQSPMAVVDQVETATLVMHSEQDLRCPIEQALRYYTALKACGVDATCVIFPGENHELSRSGRPWHRLDRFEEILAFWERQLPRHIAP